MFYDTLKIIDTVLLLSLSKFSGVEGRTLFMDCSREE